MYSEYDAVLIGAGIMSGTLATLLQALNEEVNILVVERLETTGLESSASENNAGTGHAANCELNYTPWLGDGKVSISKALAINHSFERSLEFWSSLTSQGILNPQSFLHSLPHISLVRGDSHIAFLKQRYEQLSEIPAFSGMRWSMDRKELFDWMPLVLEGRDLSESIAATRVERGTDIDFGSLTEGYFQSLKRKDSFQTSFLTEVVDLRRKHKSGWEIDLKGPDFTRSVTTPFVFIGAGGGALPLLQKSQIPEGYGYAGFPVSGQWLVCSDKELSKRHHAKVYGKAKLGSPPMSLPHLDTRWIRGERSLLFGPFAGFSSKFLKNGSYFDLFRSISTNNINSIFNVGLENLDLVTYLLKQILQNQEDKMKDLYEFFPKANSKEWQVKTAGQRVQIIKEGALKMGTEVVTAKDGSLAALLGASPGASTAVSIMLEVLEKCWPDQFFSNSWQERLSSLFPSFGKDLNLDSDLLQRTRDRSNACLGLLVENE